MEIGQDRLMVENCQHIVNKLEIVDTYMDDKNYWDPLYMHNKENNAAEDQEGNICTSATTGANEHR